MHDARNMTEYSANRVEEGGSEGGAREGGGEEGREEEGREGGREGGRDERVVIREEEAAP